MADGRRRNLRPWLAAGIFALLAWLAGGTSAAVLGRMLALPADEELLDPATLLAGDLNGEGRPPPDAGEARDRLPSLDFYRRALLERSIFDSSKVGSARSASVDRSEEDGLPYSDLDLVLIGTVVASDPSWSSALIGTPTSKRVTVPGQGKKRRRKRKVRVDTVEAAKGYGVGDEVEDGAVVAEILPREVVILREDGRRERLVAGGREEPGGAAEAPSPEDEQDVEVTGKDAVRVSRALVEGLAEDPSALSKLGRASPHRGEDGKIDGYRLSGIRSGSLGRKLGLRNGDVVHSVNGYELSSMSQAMEAYNALQSSSDLEVKITRRNKPQSLSVEID